jgi:hypothetical protein
MKYSIILISSLFIHCATANYINFSENPQEIPPKIKEEISQKKIALIGFYPYREVVTPNASGQDQIDYKPDTENSLKKIISIGKDIKNFPPMGDDTVSPVAIRDFLNQIKDIEGVIYNPDIILLIPGAEGNSKETLKMSKRDVDFYLYGYVGPRDFISQETWDLGKGKTWLTIVTSIFSGITLGTVPSVAYRDLESSIFIYDSKLFRRSELRSQSQVWLVSAWWVWFLQEKNNRMTTDYFKPNRNYEIYYKSQIYQISELFRGVLEKDKDNKK